MQDAEEAQDAEHAEMRKILRMTRACRLRWRRQEDAGAGSLECYAALPQHAIVTLKILAVISATSRRSNMSYKSGKVNNLLNTQEQCRLRVHPLGSI